MSNWKKSNISDIDYNLLFENEDEKRRVLSLPQLQREEIIMNKMDEYQRKVDREHLIKGTYDDPNRINKFENKTDALKDIKKRKFLKKQVNSSPESGEISNEDEEYHESTKKKKGKKEKKQIDDEEKEESESSLVDLNEVDKGNEVFVLDMTEIEKIRISRMFFEKFHDQKGFDDIVKGCLVRLNFGNKKTNISYMLAIIKDVINVPDEPYRLNDKTYIKYFIGKHADLEKKFPFTYISNGSIEQAEFEKWKLRMSKSGLDLPDQSYVKTKETEIERLVNYNPSNNEVLQNIDEKRKNKIKNRDKTLVVTYELSTLSEKYLATKHRIKDIEDELFLLKGKEKEEKEGILLELRRNLLEEEELIEILNEIQSERIQESKDISKNELSSKINQRNIMRQKEKDVSNRILNKKRNLEAERDKANPYKRRECNPIGLFSSKENEGSIRIESLQMTKIKEDNFTGTPKELYDKRRKEILGNMKIFKEFDCVFISQYENIKERFNSCSEKIMNEKKGLFGVLRSARIDVKELINRDNK